MKHTAKKKFKIFSVGCNGRVSFIFGLTLLTAASFSGEAATLDEFDQTIKDNRTTFYGEFFDRIIYNPFARAFRFDQLLDQATQRNRPALDVNVFDEVPDSSFFANRQGRTHLTSAELERGPDLGHGPNPNGPWKILKGKSDGASAGFLIEDSEGVRYLIKFDPKDNPEMTTSTGVIAHKFFYAFGYHVAEYYLVQFNPSILTLDPGATYYNDDGFKKPLTESALRDLLDRIPKYKGGVVRTLASKMLLNSKGYTPFEGRRPDDPEDLIPHEDRRSLRALRVFASWLNHYDLREGNTLDVLESENGRAFVKHYLFDFDASLGSATDHPKVPAAGFEYIVDSKETVKAMASLKLAEKPWEKRWDALNRTVPIPELGNFDNREFDPGRWKTELPYQVFDRLTDSDAFWAAKMIMSFSDADVKTLVKAGEFSNPEHEVELANLLIERRNLIGRYWFSKVTPLDQVRLTHQSGEAYEIRFSDLAVTYGFAQDGSSRYRLKIQGAGEEDQQSETPSFSFTLPSETAGAGRAVLLIQVRRGAKENWSSPPLRVVLARTGSDQKFEVAEISHGV